MLRFEIKELDDTNPLYFAVVVSGDTLIGTPKYKSYLITAETKEQAVKCAINAIPVDRLMGGVQLMAVRIYRVAGKSKVVTPRELHHRLPTYQSIDKNIWFADVGFKLVDLDKAIYQVDINSSLEYKDAEIERVDIPADMRYTLATNAKALTEQTGLSKAVTLHLQNRE